MAVKNIFFHLTSELLVQVMQEMLRLLKFGNRTVVLIIYKHEADEGFVYSVHSVRSSKILTKKEIINELNNFHMVHGRYQDVEKR